MARRRNLRPEEQELWQAVARTTNAMHRPRKKAAPKSDETAGIEPQLPPLAEPPTLDSFEAALKAVKPLALFGRGKKPKIEEKPSSRIKLDLAPTIREALASAPLNMDAKVHGKMTRGKLLPEARIDLHGLTLAEAHPELIRFILNAQSQGLRLVLVITGKGKEKEENWPMPSRIGALRHQVPQWLRMAPLGPAVLQVAQAHLRHGGTGAYYVYLRRR